MSSVGFMEILVILGAAAIPCIGLLVVGALVLAVIFLVRKRR
jgi:hypothetical protein